MSGERIERRLAAILAADVAGYSRLMGDDEEGTLRDLKAYRNALLGPKVAEHRGRIVKTTGDGALVEFQSVVNAVRCAAEMQRGMAERNIDVPAEKRIEFRIGVHQATSLATGATYSATGSISPPAWRDWPSPAAFASAGSYAMKSAASSISSSTTWASGKSRISPGQCTCLRFGSAVRRQKRRPKNRPCRCPTSCRLRFCRSRT